MLHQEILNSLLNSFAVHYIVLKTKYTTHHIEKLMPTCKDRGRWKWFAESSQEYWEGLKNNDEEAKRSHVDGGDLFPRLYFSSSNLVSEISAWLQARNLKVLDVEAPKV